MITIQSITMDVRPHALYKVVLKIVAVMDGSNRGLILHVQQLVVMVFSEAMSNAMTAIQIATMDAHLFVSIKVAIKVVSAMDGLLLGRIILVIRFAAIV